MATSSKNTGYSVNLVIDGEKVTIPLQFEVEDSPTKKGINMQFLLSKDQIKDPRKKQEFANKISIALQKKFGEAGIAVDFNERNAYVNVVSFIVPMYSVSNWLINTLKGK